MFGFPVYSRVTYKKNFLRSVTFQIKYEENKNVLTQKEKLIDILSPVFPNNREENLYTINVSNDNKTQILPKNEGIAGFLFETKDKLKSINISDISITISINGQQYIDFETCWAELEPKVFEIFKTCNIPSINWISIRKINLIQLELPKEEMAYKGIASIFNKALIDQYLTIPGKEHLYSGISNFSLQKENESLTLTLGLIPSTLKSIDLLLDIDLISKENLKTEKIKDKFFSINQEIFNVFNWSLQDKAIETLK